MTTIHVMEDWQADAVAAMAEAATEDMTKLWQHVAKKLPEEQERLWKKGIRKPLAKATVKARQKRPRSSYYGKYAPTGGVSRSEPRLKWTGQLQKATEKFTKTTQKGASIDADKNYTGPLKSRTPFKDFVEKQITLPGGDPWDVKRLESVVDKALEVWLSKDIIPAVASKAQSI